MKARADEFRYFVQIISAHKKTALFYLEKDRLGVMVHVLNSAIWVIGTN